MRKYLRKWLVIFLIVVMTFTSTGLSALAKENEKEEAIRLLSSSHSVADLNDKIKPFSEYCYSTDRKITEKVSLGTMYSLTISDKTTISNLPEGYDPKELIEWGKYPGLNMDILHKYGFTGKGATIAYVDQPYNDHEQFSNLIVHYTNNSGKTGQMHGDAVLSLLAGKDIGIAPEAEVYFYGHSAWKADQTTHAECLYQIIEQNKKLPKDKKISMVGFSDNIDPSEKNTDEFEKAVKACEEVGIMVWFCGEYGAASFIPLSDKDNPENLTWANWWKPGRAPELVFVPESGRTTANTDSGNKYIYWSQGGLSWTMPYMLGLYAIIYEIDPTLTQDDIRKLVVETAYINSAGMNIVNPVELVCTVLDGVGRTKEAKKMRKEAKTDSEYIYALMNTALMSKEDISSVGEYLASLTDAQVLVFDTAGYQTASDVYDEIKKDAKKRGGSVAGIQIFGTSEMVPAFTIKYKAQMISGVDDAGTVLTDFFYSNLDNDTKIIGKDYSIYDQFENKLDVELVPQWPVVRLPLEEGEYSAYFDKYFKFVEETGLQNQTIVNFSNPIFASSKHQDDMGVFLQRMDKMGYLDITYRLYGNLQGDYPITTKVLGDFTAANLKKENKKGVAEFIINSHGQQNNIDQCYFQNGKESRQSFINSETINKVLSNNYYYLDCWTCNNGYDMKNNLTTTALNGNCVGMFSATGIISNNGVNNQASVSKMKESNFYYFYYSYLKALNDGASRSESFYTAQKEYAKALLTDSKNKLRGEGNYQFNLYNLLVYSNFGVIEPNVAAISMYDNKGLILSSDISEEEAKVQSQVQNQTQNAVGNGLESIAKLTAGKKIGSTIKIEFEALSDTKNVKIKKITADQLNNGYVRFTMKCTVPKGSVVCIFNPPDGDVFKNFLSPVGSKEEILQFDLLLNELKQTEYLTLNFIGNDGGREYYSFPTTPLLDAISAQTEENKKGTGVSASFIKKYEAKIGEKGYTTLAKALKTAKPGDTVTLVKDVSDIGNVTVKAGVTLDGMGHTISGYSTVNTATSGNVVIRNVLFKDILSKTSYVGAVHARELTREADVAVVNCTFDNMQWYGVVASIQTDGLEDTTTPTLIIVDNIFLDSDTKTKDKVSKRTSCMCHIYITPMNIRHEMKKQINLTIAGNKLYEPCGAPFVIQDFVVKDSEIYIANNYVERPSGIGIHLSLDGSEEKTYNGATIIESFADENFTTVIRPKVYLRNENPAGGGWFYSDLDEVGWTEHPYHKIAVLMQDIEVSGSLEVPGTIETNGHTIILMKGSSLKVNGKLTNIKAENGSKLVVKEKQGAYTYTTK